MRRTTAAILGALGVGLFALPAAAQAPPGPVRGTVQSLEGNKLTVSGASGPAVVMLDSGWKLTVLKRIDVGAIKPGSFIGTTNVDKPDGSGQSTEVHVFPPGQRGGEGHFPMPGGAAMMTNGDVTAVVTSAKGQELDIKYNGRGGAGVRHVVVPPGTPVVLFSEGDPSSLKPGAQVMAFGAPGADGAVHAAGVLTGENGGPLPF